MFKIIQLLTIFCISSKNASAFLPSSITAKQFGCESYLQNSNGDIIDLDDSNYRDLFGNEKVLLIDACAKWCGPCKLIEPIVGRCAEKWKDSLVVGRYDVDSNNNDVKIELLLQGVVLGSLPSLILVHNNKTLRQRNGVISDDELEEFVQDALADADAMNSLQVKSMKAEQMKNIASNEPARRPGFIQLANEIDDYMLADAF